MAFRLQMGLEGETQIDRILGITVEGVTNFREPLEESKTIILDRVQQNFDRRGALFGGWKPRKIEKPWPLLEQTGKMRRNFDGEVTETRLKVGNKDPKFPYHQSNKPRKKLPRRVMLTIDAPTATLITKAFQLYLVNLMRGRR